jgi:hypothetical protein
MCMLQFTGTFPLNREFIYGAIILSSSFLSKADHPEGEWKRN